MTAAFDVHEETAPGELTPEMAWVDQFLAQNPDWISHADLLVKPPSSEEIAEWHSEAVGAIVDSANEAINVGGFIVTRGALYCHLRSIGNGHNMAEMIAMQRGPGLNTDTVFFSGSKPLYNQFESMKHLGRYLNIAKQHGFTPNKNATYISSLARFPGDPEAFVDQSQGRSYIKKLIEQRGGRLNMQSMDVVWNEPESDPLDSKNCKPLAEDIVQQRARQMIRKEPGLAKMDRRELRQNIIDKHGAK
jgi:hypothetical protein